MEYPTTPDGRYFVVGGKLWRCTDPRLPDDVKLKLTTELMQARNAVGRATRAEDAPGLAAARKRVDKAKRALGERGPVWWTDGSPDYNRHKAASTPYADWFFELRGNELGSTRPGAKRDRVTNKKPSERNSPDKTPRGKLYGGGPPPKKPAGRRSPIPIVKKGKRGE